MAQFHLFGVATGTGESFRRQSLSAFPDCSLYTYSRQPNKIGVDARFADFRKPEEFHPAGDLDTASVWISFGPIWLLAPFFEQLALRYPERLTHLSGLIVSSSSSAITKRFASNLFDRELAARLITAEDQLFSVCHSLGVECRILRPTIIYGQIGPYGDRNFSRFLQILRRVPLFPVPSDSGLRQPIHASQLSAVALHLARQLAGPGLDPDLPERIALGGDTSLSYESMIRALQKAQPASDPTQRCRLLPIPNRLFFSLAAPMLPHSPKAFDAVLRMGANLAGFTPAHQLLGTDPQPFPVLPLS
jgi:hypothetical protein